MGLSKPDLFALGAAIGFFKLSINFKAILLSGILTAKVFKPALAKELKLEVFFLLRTIVKGHGQNN